MAFDGGDYRDAIKGHAPCNRPLPPPPPPLNPGTGVIPHIAPVPPPPPPEPPSKP